jgi:hypothetical protein
MPHGRKTSPRKKHTPLALIALCDALVARHTTTAIVQYGYFRGHPVVGLEGEACERYAHDLTSTVDEHGESLERPCVQCGLTADPDGPAPCLGMLPGVTAACCGHGVDEPYVLAHGSLRGQQALDYFSHYGVGPKEDADGRRP